MLLGGDADGGTGSNIVPARALWGMTAKECSPPNIAGDIYYACLDGTWNGDGDNIYGEAADSPDLLAEVYVGRAPVDNAAELANFVRKTIAYETAACDVYLNYAWLVGEMLDGTTHGMTYKEEVRGGSSSNGHTTAGIPDSYVIGELSDQGGGGTVAFTCGLTAEFQHPLH